VSADARSERAAVSALRTSQGGAAGRWTAAGTADRGTITIRYANGNVQRMTYRVLRERKYCSARGCDVELDGRWYGRTSAVGTCRH